MIGRQVLALVWAATTTSAACGRSQGIADQDLGELVIANRAPSAPIDVARAATDPTELSRALMRPYTTAVEALGPHTVEIATSSSVEEAGKPSETRTEQTLLELGDLGTYHARYDNSADYGRETIVHGGRMYLRPRYQRWHGRAPETADEASALRDEYAAPLAATWELVGFAAALADQGAAPIAGRAGRKIAVTLAPRPPAPPSEGPSQRKWREQRRVEALTGEIILDAERGVPLAVKLAGTIAFSRDGHQFKLKVTLDSTISRLGATPIAPPAPAEVVATPERLREVDDRDFLLDGIAPPIRKRPDGAALVVPPPVKPAAPPVDLKPDADAEPKPPRRRSKSKSDDDAAKPETSEPAKPESAKSEPAKSEPAKPEPAKPEPAKEPTP